MEEEVMDYDPGPQPELSVLDQINDLQHIVRLLRDELKASNNRIMRLEAVVGIANQEKSNAI